MADVWPGFSWTSWIPQGIGALMYYDIFFSICQTPVHGETPSESTMLENFFGQVIAADSLGFGTAWIAESHLSSEVQKRNQNPVIPHWGGEIGLNVDITQIAHQIFARTRRIEVGSAVMNILCNGGPVAAAERIAYFCALHGLDEGERRKLHVGFSAGRFDFMNRAYGIKPRNAVEQAAWKELKGKTFAEASEIFIRLLRGEMLNSEQVRTTHLSRSDFPKDEEWKAVLDAHGSVVDKIDIERRFTFEDIKIIPQRWRRELLQLVIGSHDPDVQEHVNKLWPVQVFNLSITSPQIIEDTHARMAKAFHADGGPWKRHYMPRTVFVFLNEEKGMTPESRREAAQNEARNALGAYWKALEGTIDSNKVDNATNNALVGNAEDVAQEIVERFHPEDRLMLWFDFFNHDSERVIRNMHAFQQYVAPRVAELTAQRGSGAA